jgi:hypothetical protein
MAIERRSCVGGIHLRHAPIEPLGRCNVTPLFGGLSLFKGCISVVSRLFNFEHELAGLVGAARHLFDKDAVRRVRKQLQIRQALVITDSAVPAASNPATWRDAARSRKP